MEKSRGAKIVIIIALALFAGSAHATTHEDFKDKTLRITTLAAGGGFDKYSRAIARHLGKHLAGNPTFVVENMGQRQVHKNLNLASRNEITIGNFPGGQILRQLLEIQGEAQGIEFDAGKYEWVGVPVRDNSVCAVTKASGISSVEQWIASKVTVKFGGIRPGNSTDDVPKVLKAALGLPIQLVTGYSGTSGVRSHVDKGDVAGACLGWESFKATWRESLESGDVKILIQATPNAHPDLPRVPVAIDLARSREARRLIQVAIHDTSAIGRLYALPPGTPKDVVQLLQKAFMETMNDKEFLADAKKSRLDIDPVSGEEVEKIVSGLFQMDATMVAKLREILK